MLCESRALKEVANPLNALAECFDGRRGLPGGVRKRPGESRGSGCDGCASVIAMLFKNC